MVDKPQLLVVDDDVAIQELIKRRFGKHYDLTCATYQDEALAALAESHFDVVLLDLKLPRHKADLNPTPDVGIDVLRQIRERKLCRRGTAVPLAVVVVTAFGGDKVLSADFLQHRGACDYVQKPFGDGKALKAKIELALCDEGAFTAASANAIKVVQLRFNPAEPVVLVETLSYTGAPYQLLSALRDVFLPDYQALKPHGSYRGLRSAELAARWTIEDEAVRKRVATFRLRVTTDFREKLNRNLVESDIIENLRDWRGYRLNPLVVKIVAWEQDMAGPPSRV